MTTGSNESVTETKERSMDELLNAAYSEMTEDELARVVEYKAGIAAQQAQHKELVEQQHAHQAALLEQAKAASDRAFALQDSLYQASLERLNAARGGGAVGQA